MVFRCQGELHGKFVRGEIYLTRLDGILCYIARMVSIDETNPSHRGNLDRVIEDTSGYQPPRRVEVWLEQRLHQLENRGIRILREYALRNQKKK